MNIRNFFWAVEGLWIESNKTSDVSTYDQCIDAWRAYNRKVIKAPDIFGNPPDIWDKYQTDFYDKIVNTPTGVPRLGDVMIWGKSYGGIGHIAICTEIANQRNFTSFDQNDPLGSSCHFQPHTYTGVLGWLRPKNQQAVLGEEVTENVASLNAKITELSNSLANEIKANAGLRTTIVQHEGDLAEQDKQMQLLIEDNTTAESNKGTAEKALLEVKLEYHDLEVKHQKLVELSSDKEKMLKQLFDSIIIKFGPLVIRRR